MQCPIRSKSARRPGTWNALGILCCPNPGRKLEAGFYHLPGLCIQPRPVARFVDPSVAALVVELGHLCFWESSTCWARTPPTGPITAPAPAPSGSGPTSPAPSSRPSTATGRKWSRSAPPTTTRAPRAPSPRARSTQRSTCPGSRPWASTCPTGRKSSRGTCPCFNIQLYY